MLYGGRFEGLYQFYFFLSFFFYSKVASWIHLWRKYFDLGQSLSIKVDYNNVQMAISADSFELGRAWGIRISAVEWAGHQIGYFVSLNEG